MIRRWRKWRARGREGREELRTHVEAPEAALELRPLTPGFGAEVIGLDLSQPADAPLVADLRALFARYLVLLFRAPDLSPEAQIAFARSFGEVQTPELSVLSNVGPDGRPKGKHPDRATLVWHTDSSYARNPPYASLLYAEAAPATGGHTLFADTLSACEALSEADRARLPSLRVIHDLSVSHRKAGKDALPPERAKPPVEHPLMRTHPPTGRRGIYLGSHADRIAGLSDDESASLIRRLMAHTTEPRFVYDHPWRPGDLLMWDNGAVLHRGTEYDTAVESRIMRRTVLKGDTPY
jgi:alpha-ketoglutarate-dependent taurine dioxygenase